jgi:NAD(P)-dependent dehydrogenase (short-subunit alcohol dehydrogenase family)
MVGSDEPRPRTDASTDLNGRVALVTGGSRGLGREIVVALARAGAEVVIVSRKGDACEALAAEVRASTGWEAIARACDVGSWSEIDGLVDFVFDRVDHVDVLVNNAGMSPRYDDVVDVSEELYDKVLSVNLKGPFRLTALVGTRMAAGRGGSIVNVSSIGAIRPAADIVPYAAAKAGLNAMTVAFAHAFGPTVRVNAIMPGRFLTDVAASWDPEAVARSSRRFALRRCGEPDEIAGTVLYLAGPASSYTTGAVIRVDGGMP